ncbi:replication endonuclease [Pseudomonas aeruginosa]|nr:replication endonuclease [Pseudomonas aeruginosa]MBI9193583.1 replication endonuclease [Pseudomonas aeruginosa]
MLSSQLAPAFPLGSLSPQQLREYAQSIASWHQLKISALSDVQREQHSLARHQHGIGVADISGSSLHGRLERLCSRDFWLKALREKNRQARESKALASGRIGLKSEGKEEYCSDELYLDFLKQQSDRHGTNDLRKLLKASCPGAGKTYLTAKAMSLLAHEAGFQSVLITITCPPAVRVEALNGKASVASLYEYLSSFWRRLSKSLSKKFRARTDYYGIRVTELHTDGFPHWHILLFCTQECEDHLRSKIVRTMHSENRSSRYVEQHENDFFQCRPVDLRATGLSYVFKNAFCWKHGDQESMEQALRQKAAITCAGASQFQLIGANGFSGVVDRLYSALSDDKASPDVRRLALSLRDSNMLRTDLAVMKSLFTSQIEQVKVLYSDHVNRFGEHRRKATGIAVSQLGEIVKGAVTGNSSSKKNLPARQEADPLPTAQSAERDKLTTSDPSRNWAGLPRRGYRSSEFSFHTRRGRSNSPQRFILQLNPCHFGFFLDEFIFPLIE